MQEFFWVSLKFFQLFVLFGSMSVIKYFVYIRVISLAASWLVLLGLFKKFHAMPCCTFYMTFNYFKSFFIIEEMKWKIWDHFVK